MRSDRCCLSFPLSQGFSNRVFQDPTIYHRHETPGRGGGAAAAAAAPSTSLSKCRTGQESRSESSSSSISSSSSDQEQDSEQHSHTGRAPDSVSADREGGASSGAMAREKHRPENGVLGVLIRRRHRVEMGWFDSFYTFSHLFCERKRGVT